MGRSRSIAFRGARLFSLAVISAVLAQSAAAQSIQTVAGGATDDGRPAVNAALGFPAGIAFDSAGNLFIADLDKNRIQRVSAATGIIRTVAGTGSGGYTGDGGPARAASLRRPVAIAFDSSDNLYIVDQWNYRIRRVDAKTSIITTVAGRGAAGSDGDGGPAIAAALRPSAIAVSPSGDLLILDGGNNKIRRISAATQVITTVAGNGTWGYSGDGGPATAAALRTSPDPAGGNTLFIQPQSLLFDSAGNLYLTDMGNHAIRKIDSAGVITTIAGNGSSGYIGDGGPAKNALFNNPEGLAFDRRGNMFIADSGNHVVRVIDGASGIISAVAGLGRNSGFAGDGGPALKALFRAPIGIGFNQAGDLLVADSGNARVRGISAPTSVISTVAGGGSGPPPGDGGPATAAYVPLPWSLAFDSSGSLLISSQFAIRKIAPDGTISTILTSTDIAPDPFMAIFSGVTVDSQDNIYIADVGNNRIRRISGAGRTVTVAGNGTRGFGGDGGPATAASLYLGLCGMVVTPAGDLYIPDSGNHCIRKVSLQTQVITTIAGIPTVPGSEGDGGAAIAAHLNSPTGIALDRNILYVSDTKNYRIRRIDLTTGQISTVAGTGARGSGGDGGPATAATLDLSGGIALDSAANLVITEMFKIREVTGGIIRTVAGTGNPGFSGDGGPATEATLSYPQAVALDSRNNLYIADTSSNRIRAVFACVSVGAPGLLLPAGGASNVATAPSLTWEGVEGAFRYDVYVSPADPPSLIAKDVTTTSFVPSNLSPDTPYFWKIVAKGDPFCSPQSTATSEIRSFITAAVCGAPAAFAPLEPPDRSNGISSPVQLSWQPSAGASLYDLYFGAANPPPLAVGGLTGTNYATPLLIPNTTYSWFVVAHAACDATLTTATPVQSFRAAGNCSGASAFNVISPANGSSNVALTTTLSWSPSSGAAAYDLYLGTSSTPPAFLVELTRTSVPVTGLLAGRTYYWRVVAKSPCDPSKNVSTATASFMTTTAGCTPAPATSISFVPPGNVALGQTYNVSWRESPDLGADGYYVIERSIDPSFATLVDRQETFTTSSSFVSSVEGTYYHRVRAVRGCDPSRPGAPSAAAAVKVVAGRADVVFTIQPEAVVTALGETLEDRQASFALENLGGSPLLVLLGKIEIDSRPFFTIVDPSGGNPAFVTLEPKKPKHFEIHFSGAPNDEAGTYQGLVVVASVGEGLAITPYAFINLKVGGGSTAKPAFALQGTPTEYAAFPPFAGDDAARAPISVDVRNDGDSPMEIGGEVGPEVWLVPESGWNALPIPPRATRTVRLRSQRTLAPNGSALPRYTYFTVRSRNGQSARLLVQDNDAPSGAGGRSSLLAPGSRSFVVPHVVTTSTAISRVRLTNIASTAVQADVYFTPTGADGFDASSVKRVTIVVPPNDVVSLIDPLVQLFNAAKPADGSLEVRAAPDAIGSLIVSASVLTPSAGGGSFSYEVPVLMLGEGARAGTGQTVVGVTADTGTAATLILAETSGIDPVRARVTLFDKSGARKGDAAFDVARYGRRSVADVVKALGGLDSLDRGRIDVSVESGGGAVAALVTVIDRSSGRGATIVGQPSGAAGTSSSVAFAFRRLPSAGSAPVTVAPMVVNGAAFPVPNTVYRTSVGLTTSGSKVTAVVTYRDGSGASAPVSKTVDLFPGLLLHFDNVLEDLFGVATGSKATGSIFIESAAGAEIYAQLYSRVAGAPRWSIASNLPLLPTVSDVLTSLQSRRPLYLDGLEQSIDDTRGTKWLVVLDETGGSGGTVSVRLYEAGNRSVPIAERTISIAAYEQLSLDVFRELGLDGEDRRKDRTNVLCVVAASAGGATISASGIAIDNRTGDTHTYLFSPNGGVPATGVSRVSLVSQVPTVSKRRIVKP